ncbi:MAG: hypothetical protein CL933_06380 [Deltaproteobacteria bacterium]|nr:hypothetical protein [Deltaproteobacteria bacterium]
MRFRLITFLPPAALITLALLFSASSFVPGVERSLIGEWDRVPTPIRVQRFEAECDLLQREIDELSRSVTYCDAEPGAGPSERPRPVRPPMTGRRRWSRAGG